MSAQKDALRKVYLRLRRALPPQQKIKMDAAIAARVVQTEAYLTAQTVFCYVSLSHEVDTCTILADAWMRGKRVAVPRCRENGQMDFYAVSAPDDLTAGKAGIPEPRENCPLCIPEPTDLCIVPCLAMDARGFRLGYGGGYYDRYLSEYPMLTLGLCYADFVTQALPAEMFDVPIQMLIAEREV